eukprot:TRINITY_DN11299_c0_g1_i2.p1 TRINITY_DN11299_c0_g1~~TRINITY_DN11299_c0_g1_i2.p1  ORF type:complete len:931 (+),score=146.26 TRINITY_DN11299_c0_g1_i2:21-2813(+)
MPRTRSIDSASTSWGKARAKRSPPESHAGATETASVYSPASTPAPPSPSSPSTSVSLVESPPRPASPPPAASSPRHSPQASKSSLAYADSPNRSPRTSPRRKRTITTDGDKHDPQTHQVGTLREVDARCSLQVNGLVWTGEREGSITIRALDGTIVHVIERKKGAYVWCLLQANEKEVWVGCSDGFIRVIDIGTFSLAAQFARHAGGGGGVQCLAHHEPSGTVFSGSNDFEILAWDANSHEFRFQFHGHGGAVRALATDTTFLYSGSDDTTIIKWDVKTAQKVAQWSGHSKGVHSLCLTETSLWSGSEDGTIRVWNTVTGECISVADCVTGPVEVLTLVGTRVWSGAGNTVCLWDASNAQLIGVYPVHTGYLSSILLAGRSADYIVWTTASDGTVNVWQSHSTPEDNTELKREVTELRHRISGVQKENSELRNQLNEKDEANASLRDSFRRAEGEATTFERRLAALQKVTAELGITTEDVFGSAIDSVPAPTGEVTIAFTDVQSSTELWERHTTAMEQSIKLHNAVMRQGIEQFRGYEVKTEGDAFMVSFQSPVDAVNWCLAMQTKLLEADWPQDVHKHPSANVEQHGQGFLWRGLRVRMGCHIGSPTCEKDPKSGRMDYFGRMVNKAARVGGLGKGGQIVISDDVLRSIGDQTLLHDPVVTNLGEKKLKGIAEPCTAYSLVPGILRDRRFDSEEASPQAIETDDQGKTLGGLRAKSAQYFMFMSRLKERVKEFPAGISALQAELAKALEANELLIQQKNSLEKENQSKNDRISHLERENESLHQRLRTIDDLFRSRLSLLTDVYKLYKQVDEVKKATPVEKRGAVNGTLGEFKRVIATHYTDDELAHLGTSRHLFPSAPQSSPPRLRRHSRTAPPSQLPRHHPCLCPHHHRKAMRFLTRVALSVRPIADPALSGAKVHLLRGDSGSTYY